MPDPDRPTQAVRACVIGAGPAGLEVSRILRAAGVSHDVIDENHRPGGNADRRSLHSPRTDLEAAAGSGLATLRLVSDVVDLSSDRVVTWVEDGTLHRRRYDVVFLCTGAYDGSLPRRPTRGARIETTGALHSLLKADGFVPRGRIVVAGSGPLLWIAAGDLAAAGASIAAVADAMRLRDYAALGPFAALFPRSAFQFARSLIRLLVRQVMITFGSTADVSFTGMPRVDGREIQVEHLAVTDFFVPQTQLARSAGCAQVYSPGGHYFYSATDPLGRSSVPGVFVCGEGQGIHGRDYAIVSGSLAARAYAAAIGRAVPGGHWLMLRRRLLRRYARALETRMYRGSAADWPPDAVLCHCEAVPVERVCAAITDGLRDPTSIKSVTRCGMGICQGRYCEPLLNRLLDVGGRRPIEPLFQKGFVRPVVVRELLDADV